MNDLLTFGLSVFTGFFAVMDPIGDIPIFLSLLPNATHKEKKKISKKASIIAFIIGLLFIVFGKYIFNMFGISLPAFKITGGILLFYIGFEMLQSKETSVGRIGNVKTTENIAVTPLAVPIITGPGTIVTGMNYVSHATTTKIILIILIFGFMCFINYLAFILADVLLKKTGTNTIAAVEKIMGLIIAVIGTNMVIDGIKISFNLI